MKNLKFRVLYREFLFRMVDPELLAPDAQGDSAKLAGQFASLLILCAIILAVAGLILGSAAGKESGVVGVILKLSAENFLIATTMLAVGLFAIVSWDSTFPDRRDVMILAPLPVRARTMFGAKVSAVAASLGLIIVLLAGLGGLAWPYAFNTEGLTGFLRLFAAYWITLLASGVFVYSTVLAVQGITALLFPRRLFLRISSFLQLASFGLFVGVYFLQPIAITPVALGASMGNDLPAWVPSFWFLGLYQQIAGSSALNLLAWRAWLAVSISVAVTLIAYTAAYWRSLRRIVEEPDIAPGVRGGIWLPRFGDSFRTAIVQFAVRSLLRSRRHRILLAFYLGVAFAMIIYFLKSPVSKEFTGGRVGNLWNEVNVALLASGFLLMGFWVVGTRVVFAMPLDLRANWIFRTLPLGESPALTIARRRAQLVLSVFPVWTFWCAILLTRWPWRQAAAHLLILWLAGITLVELCICGKQKIPFTCSYLPGKSHFHITFWISVHMILLGVGAAAEYERDAFGNPARLAELIAGMLALAAFARWRTYDWSRSGDAFLLFEEESPVVQTLGLNKDGATIITPA